ncbi:hypothetical protein [Micromonospora sp. CPCC 206061]|uniref:hypothetical protein n=1 Tax=Micromonospora sp. CPCC 206061 TaxID=3122410 RepID=UPI002FF37B2B
MTEDVQTTPASAPPASPPGEAAPGAAVLAVLALVWLAAMMWSAHRVIVSGEGTLAITSAALALPSVISAGIVAGAGVSLAVAHLLRRHVTVRFVAAIGAGLLTGLGAALAVVSSYGEGEASTILAGTLAAAVTVGGAVAGVRARSVVGAVVSAGLVVFAVGLVLDNFKENLISLYGAGDDASSRLSAAGWAALTTAVISGLVAGLVAYFYLRWTQRRAGAQVLRWPAYATAGAGPGLALMVAEVIVRTLGSRVMTLAGEVSEADGTVQRMLDESRVNYALVVLFVGAISAIMAFGRSLPSK